MTEREARGIRYLTFESFDEADGVSALVTTRHGGESTRHYATLNLGRSSGDDANVVARNRARVASLVESPVERLTFGSQVHGARVAVVGPADAGRTFEETDALITNAPGVPLVILTADCAAVFVFDPVRHAAGIAHAGWRGTVAGIAGATVTAMRDAFGSDPADLIAAVGPSIGPCCYEVGSDVIDTVQASLATHVDDVLADPDMASAGSFRGSVNEGRKHFDLWRANEHVLLDAGVRPERVEIAGLCTACHTDLFYSHRAEKGLTGRFGGMIVLPRR